MDNKGKREERFLLRKCVEFSVCFGRQKFVFAVTNEIFKQMVTVVTGCKREKLASIPERRQMHKADKPY